MREVPLPQTPHPVLAGCHPDPTVCRVGDRFVLVTSSFGYWPGLPVHVSEDLVHWVQVGHVLTREGEIDLDRLDLSDGVWAPTVRYHDGVLYVVFTVARGRRGSETYLCTATDPAGPWSPPVQLDARGIDPALFFDVDGSCWCTGSRESEDPVATGPGEIWLRELDLQLLQLVGPEHVLWHGAVRGAWVEGPRLFRRDGRYHLIAAEGGTGRNHAVTAASAPSVTGPWTTNPRSPLLTHRHLGASAHVQNVGHADLVATAAGQTWALVLGVRTIDGVHTLGREVFLAPVVWDETGPVFAPGVGALRAVGAPQRDPVEAAPSTGLLDWVSLRGPVGHAVEGTTHVLRPRPDPLASCGRPGLVGRRQDAHTFAFEATVDATALTEQSAGLVAMQHQDAWVAIRLRRQDEAVLAEVTLRSDGETTVVSATSVDGAVRLRIDSDRRAYRLGTLDATGKFAVHAVLSHVLLSTEHVGGFLGVLLALTAQGREDLDPVVFSVVDYRRQPTSAESPGAVSLTGTGTPLEAPRAS